jgi:hypothetical protein
MESFLVFLDAAGGTITRLALALFLVVNGIFAAMVILRRDRGLVNRWTKRLVVADTALLLAAGGAPVATWAARTTVRAVAAVLPSSESYTPQVQAKAPTVQQQ